MGSMGMFIGQTDTKLVVKLRYEIPVGFPPLSTADLHHIMVFPQSVMVSEGFDTAFGTKSCSR